MNEEKDSMEVADKLSTVLGKSMEKWLLLYDRITARHGYPLVIYGDNSSTTKSGFAAFCAVHRNVRALQNGVPGLAVICDRNAD